MCVDKDMEHLGLIHCFECKMVQSLENSLVVSYNHKLTL